MEAPGNTFRRLVAALEILVAEEQCLLRLGDPEQLLALQQRTEPIVDRLAELRRNSEVADSEAEPLLPRLAALQARRASSLETMDSRLAEMRATLTALQSARSRLGRLGHAYGQKPMAAQSAAAHLSLSA
jgi:chromosome segregation ATPase